MHHVLSVNVKVLVGCCLQGMVGVGLELGLLFPRVLQSILTFSKEHNWSYSRQLFARHDRAQRKKAQKAWDKSWKSEIRAGALKLLPELKVQNNLPDSALIRAQSLKMAQRWFQFTNFSIFGQPWRIFRRPGISHLRRRQSQVVPSKKKQFRKSFRRTKVTQHWYQLKKPLMS